MIINILHGNTFLKKNTMVFFESDNHDDSSCNETSKACIKLFLGHFWFACFGPYWVHITVILLKSSFGSGPQHILLAVSVRLFGEHQGFDGNIYTFK